MKLKFWKQIEKKEDFEIGKFSKCVIQEKWKDLKPYEDSLKKVKLVLR